MEEVKKLLEQAFSAAAEHGLIINAVNFDYEIIDQVSRKVVISKGQRIDAELMRV